MHVMRRRARLVVTAVTLVALAVLASLLPATATTAAAGVPELRVSVLGDSVLLGARDALLTELAGWQLDVDTRQDLSLLGGISRLSELAGTSDVVVLDLGYNDTSAPGVFGPRVDQAMAALASVPHVIWLNQREFQPGRADMNATLVAAASQHPNLEVVDWNAVTAAHPEYLAPDGIHLGPEGQQAMADLVSARLDAYASSLSPKSAPTSTATPTSTTASPTSDPSRVRAAGAIEAGRGDESTTWWWAAGGGALVLAAAVAVVVAARRRRSSAR
jgi:hypothetical protein